MSSIVLGRDGLKKVTVDIDVLLRTRLLVQANSGGGKSWLLRRFAEQAFGKIPLIIVDPEGEFSSLREKFGFVLVGKGGETPADPRSAALLAHKLLELQASAVCDIYELKPQTRHHWVKVFLEALVDAPKKLWRPTIVIVDEAHVYCPEKGQGESEAFGATADLVTRGRKRGFCAVFATQRLAKLSKNVSAEMLNRLIGQTFEDVDQERAADLLSIPRSERTKFFADMKVIDPGYFWALGRAIAKSRVLVKIGDVATTHPEPGSAEYSAAPPPAPARVQALLPKLADLPKEAEDKAKTEADFRVEIRSLKAQLQKQKTGPAVEVEEWKRRATLEAKRHLEHGERINKELRDLHGKLVGLSARIPVMIDGLSGSLESIKVSDNGGGVSQRSSIISKVLSTKPLAAHDPSLPKSAAEQADREALSGPEQRIIDAIAWMNSIGIEEPEQVAVAFLARYTYGAGSYNNPRGRLRSRGLVEYRPNDRIRLTDDGRALARVFAADLTQEELHKRVMDRLPNPAQRILQPLLEAYPEALTNEELAKRARYAMGKGAFNNPKGRLRTLGLIEYPEPGKAVASSVLFFE